MSTTKPALESRPSAWDAEQALDLTQLSKEKMDKLREHTYLLDALDHWIMIADMSLKGILEELAKVVNNLYGFKGGMEVYRGFDPKSSFQDTMGLSDKGFFGNAVKEYAANHTFVYSNRRNPLSLSTSYQIAQAFGPTVVRVRLDPKKVNFLRITDELAALISERRKIKPMTQKEVIVFPPYELTCHVVEK